MNAMVEVSLNSELNCTLWNVLKLNNDKGFKAVGFMSKKSMD